METTVIGLEYIQTRFKTNNNVRFFLGNYKIRYNNKNAAKKQKEGNTRNR